MSEPRALVEHFFRHEIGRLVAVLTRSLGVRRLALVEDVVAAPLVQARVRNRFLLIASQYSRQGRQGHDEWEVGREIIDRLLVGRNQLTSFLLSQSHVEAIVVAVPGS